MQVGLHYAFVLDLKTSFGVWGHAVRDRKLQRFDDKSKGCKAICQVH
jgi:hypothetical protein